MGNNKNIMYVYMANTRYIVHCCKTQTNTLAQMQQAVAGLIAYNLHRWLEVLCNFEG